MDHQITTKSQGPIPGQGNTKHQPSTVRRGLEQKVKSLEEQLDPSVNPLARSQVGAGGYEKQKQQLDGMKSKLESMTPPVVPGDERGKLEARSKQLENCMKYGSIQYRVPDMPSKMEMKNNPDDSTRRHMTWEKTWKHKTVDDSGKMVSPSTPGYGAVMEWKDIQYRLFAEEDAEGNAPGIGSIERFRPDVKGVPLAKDHTARAFSLAGNLSQEKYDSIFEDHKPLANEIQAGVYFSNCAGKNSDGKFCGAKVINKAVPYCIDHMEQLV
jgi:hypothetical protein